MSAARGLPSDKRRRLLVDLREAMGSGAAESEELDPGRFLPVIDHLRVLEPTARIVTGTKGSGKSGLFGQLTDPTAARRLAEIADEHHVRVTPAERTTWVTGYSAGGMVFPATGTLGLRIKQLGPRFRTAWLVLLVRALLAHRAAVGEEPLSLPEPPDVVRRLADEDPGDVLGAVELLETDDATIAVNDWLDRIERSLVVHDRWLFVVYDDIDVLSPDDWAAIHDGIGQLIRFWATTARRYKRLQPKIFLRSDIYRRAAVGPDIGKLALGGVELQWTSGALYSALAKRLLNHGDALREYLSPARIATDDDPVFGLIPRGADERAFRGFAERLVGKYMGAGPSKGYTYRWIPNHLQDGNGHLFPRPAVRLLDAAAEREQRHPAATGSALLHHSSLRGALDQVSEARVRELTEHEHAEFPWMERLVQTFRAHGYSVPMTPGDFHHALAKVPWSDGQTPPAEGTELADYLEELGIARRRTDGRFDIGDLYLAGFGLKRKGGVKRPR